MSQIFDISKRGVSFLLDDLCSNTHFGRLKLHLRRKVCWQFHSRKRSVTSDYHFHTIRRPAQSIADFRLQLAARKFTLSHRIKQPTGSLQTRPSKNCRDQRRRFTVFSSAQAILPLANSTRTCDGAM